MQKVKKRLCIRFEDGESYLADCEIIRDGHDLRFEHSTVGLERGMKDTGGSGGSLKSSYLILLLKVLDIVHSMQGDRPY